MALSERIRLGVRPFGAGVGVTGITDKGWNTTFGDLSSTECGGRTWSRPFWRWELVVNWAEVDPN